MVNIQEIKKIKNSLLDSFKNRITEEVSSDNILLKVNNKCFFSQNFDYNRKTLSADRLYYSVKRGLFYTKNEDGGFNEIRLQENYHGVSNIVATDIKAISPEIEMCLFEDKDNLTLCDRFLARASLLVAASFFNKLEGSIENRDLAVEYDSSLDTVKGETCELKFTKLEEIRKIQEKETDLVKILTIINPFATTNATCGHHIHISINNFATNEHFYNFVKSLGKWENREFLQKVCKRNFGNYRDYVNLLNYIGDLNNLDKYIGELKRAMNPDIWQTMSSHSNFVTFNRKTIEVRLFKGTLNADIIASYYSFIKLLLKKTKKMAVIFEEDNDFLELLEI